MWDIFFGEVFSELVARIWRRMFPKKTGKHVKSDEIVIDVRTPGEYAEEHFKRSINIPLDNIDSVAKKYEKAAKIIVCCASGARSEKARIRLEDLGFENVENAGSWTNLKES